jgi:hypothetical protein
MSDILVQVVEGNAWETSKTFSPGAPVGPLGLGTAADWRVEGPGVGPIHAYFYYDGAALLAASAAPYTATANGAPLGSDWTPLPLPCELSLGGARFQIQDAAAFDDAATNAPAEEIDDAATGFLDRSGAPLPPGSPLHHPGDRRPVVEDESTKFLPIEQMRKGADGPSPGAPSPGGPPAVVVAPDALPPRANPLAPTIAPGSFPTPQIEPPPGQLPPGQRPPAAPAQGGLAAAWKEASPPRKITYVLLPIALVAFALTMLDDPPETSAKKAKGSPRSSSSAPASASGPPPPPPIGSLPQLPLGPLLPPPERPAPKKKFPPPRTPVITLERKAVDALIAGNYKEAAELYEQLAKEHPETPIYKEALRVLKARQPERK